MHADSPNFIASRTKGIYSLSIKKDHQNGHRNETVVRDGFFLILINNLIKRNSAFSGKDYFCHVASDDGLVIYFVRNPIENTSMQLEH